MHLTDGASEGIISIQSGQASAREGNSRVSFANLYCELNEYADLRIRM